MKDDSVYLRHIAECLGRIEKNVSIGLDQFLASETIQDATLRNLQTMSEAAQRLSVELKSTHPDIEWNVSEPSGMYLSTIISVSTSP